MLIRRARALLKAAAPGKDLFASTMTRSMAATAEKKATKKTTETEEPPEFLVFRETPETMFRDFAYSLTRTKEASAETELSPSVAEDRRPLVLVFGWAGSSEKNLDKYCALHRRAGCHTLGYRLPSRFILNCTADVPHVARRLLYEIKREGMIDRPMFLHSMSDTGLMVYQGIDKVCREDGLRLDIRGAIMDSCPGRRPNVNLFNILALLAVNYISVRRDGLDRMEALQDTKIQLTHRVLPNLARWTRGQPIILSEIDNTFAGDFLRADRKPWPELFLYSKTDFYLPWRHMEETLAMRRKEQPERRVTAKRWDKSAHVGHLMAHRAQYEATVRDFLWESYFKSE